MFLIKKISHWDFSFYIQYGFKFKVRDDNDEELLTYGTLLQKQSNTSICNQVESN